MIHVDIQEFAEICGLKTGTMKFYKTKGMIPEPDIKKCKCCDGKMERWEIDTVLDYKNAKNKPKVSFHDVPEDTIRRMTDQKITRKDMAKQLNVPEHIIAWVCRYYKIRSKINNPEKPVKKTKKTDLFNAFLSAPVKQG